VWFNLGQEFVRRGHEVTHISRGFKDLPKSETLEGVQHRRVSGFSSPATTPRRMLLDFWYALRAMSQLPPADILVTNTFWLPALECRRSRGIPYVHVARYPKGQLKLYRKAILQTVSEPIRKAILAEHPGAAGRVRVIAYPLSDRYLRPAVQPASQTLLYTGRVHPEKGVHLLVKAFAHLSPIDRAGWKLRIVGPSEIAYGGGGDAYLAELRATAASAGGSVEFVGRIFDENRLIEHLFTPRWPNAAKRSASPSWKRWRLVVPRWSPISPVLATLSGRKSTARLSTTAHPTRSEHCRQRWPP
jgi:glycosyltransferase involved in cell wall biosynthesis